MSKQNGNQEAQKQQQISPRSLKVVQVGQFIDLGSSSQPNELPQQLGNYSLQQVSNIPFNNKTKKSVAVAGHYTISINAQQQQASVPNNQLHHTNLTFNENYGPLVSTSQTATVKYDKINSPFQVGQSTFGAKQQRQLVNKSYKRQLQAQTEQQRQASPAGNGGYSSKGMHNNSVYGFPTGNNKKGVSGMSQKIQHQQQMVLMLGGLQQQQASRFQEKEFIEKQQSKTTLQSIILTQGQQGTSPQNINIKQHAYSSQNSNGQMINSTESIGNQGQQIFSIPASSHLQIPIQEGPPRYTAYHKSQAAIRFSHFQPHNPLPQDKVSVPFKLDSILQSQPLAPMQRDQLNASAHSSGQANNHGLSSSKKHREFMKAQELSKVITSSNGVSKESSSCFGLPKQTTAATASNVVQLRSKLEDIINQNRSISRDEDKLQINKLTNDQEGNNQYCLLESQTQETQKTLTNQESIVNETASLVTQSTNRLSQNTLQKCAAQLPRQPSTTSQQHRSTNFPQTGQQIVNGTQTNTATLIAQSTQNGILICGVNRSGSASSTPNTTKIFNQQAQTGQTQTQTQAQAQANKQMNRMGNDRVERRRESSAGSRLNGISQNNVKSGQNNTNKNIMVGFLDRQSEESSQIPGKQAQTNPKLQVKSHAISATNVNQNVVHSQACDLPLTESRNARNHSVELKGGDPQQSSEDEDFCTTQTSNKSSINTATVNPGGAVGAGCGCDSLSQVSEESAFEEDDIEEQKDCAGGVNGIQNDCKSGTIMKKANTQDDNEDGKKKKQVTIKILASMPNNAREQEEAFFASGFTVNPVFEYDNPIIASKFISQFKKPRSELMSIATKIMDAFLAEYGSESNYFLTEGRVITDKDETEAIFIKYLEELDLVDVALINFSEKIVAPTSVTYDNFSSKIRINIQVPIEYREGRITGVLHHEIGTHFLRRFNEIQQPWHGKRKKYGLKSCIMIEEGMGCINMMLEQSKDVAAHVLNEPNSETFEPGTKRMPFLFKPALNYYACSKASEMSFVELFNDLAKYVDNPRKRWKYVLRVKRGLGDTSFPGGLYKDQVYLEGAVKILKNRKDINFKLFYCGKINIEDIKRPKFIKKANLESIIIPKFMEDMREFRRNLDVIAKVNFID